MTPKEIVEEFTRSRMYEDWSFYNDEMITTFKKLKYVCEQWNEFVPRVWDNTKENYVFEQVKGEWMIYGRYTISSPFSFHKEEHAELFLKTFEKELESIIPLMS